MKALLLTAALILAAPLADAQSVPRFEIGNVSIESAPTASTERFELRAQLTQTPSSESRWQVTQSALRPVRKALLGGDSIFADGFELASCTP